MTLIPYRYRNDRIYMQPLLRRVLDKEKIPLARGDWRADGVVPMDSWDYIFDLWCDELEEVNFRTYGAKFPTIEQVKAVGYPTETNSILPVTDTAYPFNLIETIWEVGTNEFIGFSKTWIYGDHSTHEVTCFIPEMRNKGYHTDFNTITAKSWYLYAGGQKSTIFTPQNITPSDGLHWKDNALSSETYKECDDRVDSITYAEVNITKAEYLHWINLEENQTFKNETFTIERWFEE